MTTSRLAGATVPASTTRRKPRTLASTGLSAHHYAQAKAMRESTLAELVIDLIHCYGLKVAHFRTTQMLRCDGSVRHLTPVQGDGTGFPDLLIGGGWRVEARELKSWTGVLSAEQVVWLDVLAASGAGIGVWTPLEWFNGQIRREIEAMRPRGAA